MTDQTSNVTITFSDRLGALLSRIGRSFERLAEAQSRSKEVEALYAKSDAELARLGIRRDQIPQYVFRDRAWM
ncbi:hypothetical protein SAMN05421538_10271 [Paracoccus isoporae]|uniref:DUF1127 domain-containing protein n=1 Tax=Paracoccus isoporae TaxID=591205 RepID=A0A1G6WBA8_9RHOB|nr:hypothetical protein [Paracoccus isoporae]SDD62336.1 hypothetical protein SAMN05421538_10271 [Paracoccus isoporae]